MRGKRRCCGRAGSGAITRRCTTAGGAGRRRGAAERSRTASPGRPVRRRRRHAGASVAVLGRGGRQTVGRKERGAGGGVADRWRGHRAGGVRLPPVRCPAHGDGRAGGAVHAAMGEGVCPARAVAPGRGRRPALGVSGRAGSAGGGRGAATVGRGGTTDGQHGRGPSRRGCSRWRTRWWRGGGNRAGLLPGANCARQRVTRQSTVLARGAYTGSVVSGFGWRLRRGGLG